ncbi:2,4-dienoyl-CoA reductase-like NADH-dependent reductase (Old Yellow Enzyme family) [Rhizobium sp. PP-CC-2G-626]|nr:2,4-dienoyl-CoA reductase-like NADH-dependent reductase (Old Yellow Enzyme family) [Rhizobium sp. PP-CC-2G-626]
MNVHPTSGPVASDMPPATVASLFSALRLNSTLTLSNRIVLAPCTRNRSELDFAPAPSAIEHYASRAAAGLLITEGTLVAPEARGGAGIPGLYLDSHIRRWAEVTDAVHERGGLIFTQLWHMGRMAHSFYSGAPALAPSAVFDDGRRHGERYYVFNNEPPLEMSDLQAKSAIQAFAQAATNARRAGFDGVELHGANGYLIDQFLKQHTNRRTDRWGGSLENRARFLLDVFDACAEEIGADRIGIRLSPADYMSEMLHIEGDQDTLVFALGELEKRRAAYVHVGIEEDVVYDYLRETATQFLRRHYGGILIGNGSYTPELAANAISRGEAELFSFGRSYLANADIVFKIKQGLPLAQYSRSIYDSME